MFYLVGVTLHSHVADKSTQDSRSIFFPSFSPLPLCSNLGEQQMISFGMFVKTSTTFPTEFAFGNEFRYYFTGVKRGFFRITFL